MRCLKYDEFYQYIYSSLFGIYELSSMEKSQHIEGCEKCRKYLNLALEKAKAEKIQGDVRDEAFMGYLRYLRKTYAKVFETGEVLAVIDIFKGLMQQVSEKLNTISLGASFDALVLERGSGDEIKDGIYTVIKKQEDGILLEISVDTEQIDLKALAITADGIVYDLEEDDFGILSVTIPKDSSDVKVILR